MRGRQRLLAGDFDKAVQDYDRALHIRPTYASALYVRGVANYLRGEYRLAVADIESSIILQPDTLGNKSIMMYLATARNGGDGKGDLLENIRRIDPAAWQASIASFLLGKSTPQELIGGLHDQNPYKRRDMICLANYFASQRHLLRGEKTQAVNFLRETIRLCPKSTSIHVGAVSDLKRYGVEKTVAD